MRLNINQRHAHAITWPLTFLSLGTNKAVKSIFYPPSKYKVVAPRVSSRSSSVGTIFPQISSIAAAYHPACPPPVALKKHSVGL